MGDSLSELVKMKLHLSKVIDGCRLGVLTHLGRKGTQSMEIPGCLLYTKMGSAPHLTHDTLQMVQGVPVVTQLSLSTLVELHEVLAEYKEGIGKFIGMPESILYCSLHDSVTRFPSGYNNNKSVSTWGSGGRTELTPSKFMALQQVIQPDWFQCLSDGDTVAEQISKKRAKKSVDRSLSFLDECLQLQEKSPELQQSLMIGVIEGGDVLEERLRSAKETSKRPVAGFLLDGFQTDAMAKKTKHELLSRVVAELPEDKPRLIHGIGRPDEVLECIERGVDIFESFFPYEVTERGCALSFSCNYNLDPEAAVLEEDEESDMKGKKDENLKDGTLSGAQEFTSFEINLKEKRYQDDFRPLVNGCTCYCCENHSRAYVHHLLVTNELLAGVLLMIHNFQHYFGFFSSIRNALKEDRLHQLRGIVGRQAF
uniref:Queuine tRNA-ribosyltransferase accessory subunit 2 n=1 Tax=Salvator merianae TaxID=96440 RepID=A0A8D0BEV8_SALMN